MKTYSKIFGVRIKLLRKEQKLRQHDIAEKLNLSRQAISKYERGEREPGLDVLMKMAEYFDVSLDYLFGRTDNRLVNMVDERDLLYWERLPKVADERWKKRP